MMKNQELIDYLKECGVCGICQLRYLKARGNEYKESREYLKRLNVKCEDTEDLNNKKQRLNTCPTCLGLFSPDFQSDLIQGILNSNIQNFQCDHIVVAISIPIILQIRQLSMWFALIRKFGDSINRERAPDVPIKEAVKLILNPIICESLKKSYDINGIMININLRHIDDGEEVKQVMALNELAFPNENGKRQVVSRGLLEKQYTPKRVSETLFEKYLSIPPSIPNENLTMDSITLTGPTVFLAGRYRKMTRQLSHTPWILNGKRVMEDSIEEIIIRNVIPFFGASENKVIFMSSGREDVDVRCLGSGRPFVLEIPNSLCTTLPKKRAYQMENEIDKSLKVSVRDLQMVKREDLVHIKMGEEKKRKYYRALCKLDQPATLEILEKLNLPQGFEIQQKTPIRVLHRRPLHTRPRSIYKLKAWVCEQDARLLILDIVSQAGTYIKELVHGEFGRTSPSIASIIDKSIDIIALDVVAIDLEWPPAVDNAS